MCKARIRTLREAYGEIVNDDPKTSVTFYYFSRLVKSGRIPCKRAGRRYLVNMIDIEAYFNNPEREELDRLYQYEHASGGIRPVSEKGVF